MNCSVATRLAHRIACGVLAIALAAISPGLATAGVAPSVDGVPWVNFETPTVRPIAISPDGGTLVVANVQDNRVEVFDLSTGIPQLDRDQAIPVGIDPVTVKYRTATELWVVNHISDSISIVDVPNRIVVETIQTLDEPCDVVFAGGKAFVSCSQVNTIQVFDENTRQETGQVIVKGEDPRSLAVSIDGSKIYAAIYESGNGTTLLGGGIIEDFQSAVGRLAYPPNTVSDPLGPYGGVNPPPNGPDNTFVPPMNPENPAPPAVALIVRKDDNGAWRDDNGEDWTPFVSGANAHLSGRVPGWDLPDRDLAIIDVNSLSVNYVSRVMNINMALDVHPTSGNVYMVGTDAINELRFEPNVKAKFVRVMLGIISPGNQQVSNVLDLNSHLDYDTLNYSDQDKIDSIGDPRAIAWKADGSHAFVLGMGSNNLIKIDANGTRVQQVPTSVGQGPTGIVIDDQRNRVYVLNRFEATVQTIDQTSMQQIGTTGFFDPAPASVQLGRPFLYDTHVSSESGHLSCGSCHIDGRMDRLSWDLGDPSGEMSPVTFAVDPINEPGSQPDVHNLLGVGLESLGISLGDVPFEPFHPMKGPMTTQTLQDIIGKEPHHWRGDRQGIESFNGAFVGLNGRDTMISPVEMQHFEDFLSTIFFPPNPYRNYDNSYPPLIDLAFMPIPEVFMAGGVPNPLFPEGDPMPDGDPVRGLAIYRDGGINPDGLPPVFRNIDGGALACVTCHTLPTGMGPDLAIAPDPQTQDFTFVDLAPGPLGNRHLGLVSVDGSTNITMKIAELRNMHEKAGFDAQDTESLAGFGYVHDGSVDTLARFISEPVFQVTNPQMLADLVAFSFAFAGGDFPGGSQNVTSLEPPGPPSQDTHAGVGKQITVVNAQSLPEFEASAGLDEMVTEARHNLSFAESHPLFGRGIDLIAKARVGGVHRGWVYDQDLQLFKADRNGEVIAQGDLLAMASPSSPITFTMVPRGSGERMGIDRDLDGFYDTTEKDALSNPADPNSVPAAPQIVQDPENQTAVQGDTVTIAIVASGSPVLTYEWFKGANPLPNSNTAAYNIPAVALGDTGTYSCKVTNVAGQAQSADMTLSVFPSAANSAAFVSHSPTDMLANQNAPLTVVMNNDSFVSWSAAQGITLNVISDPNNLFGGPGAFFEINNDGPFDIVQPGEDYGFSRSVQMPFQPGVYSAQVQMFDDGVPFGQVGNIQINAGSSTEIFFTGGPGNWFGGVLLGEGSVEHNASGLCMTLPGPGDNITGWVSPDRLVPLTANSVFRIRIRPLTSQVADDTIPLLDFVYDNFNNSGFGNIYGGEVIFIDQTGGANGVGRPQGLNEYEAWATPNSVLTPQWNGFAAGTEANSAFTAAADSYNDIRLVFRSLDLDSAGILAQNDLGTLCLSSLLIDNHNYDSIMPSAEGDLFVGPITNGRFAPQTLDQAAENAGTANIDDGQGIANYQLTASGAGSRKTLLPFDGTQPVGKPQLYPISWLGGQLIRASMVMEAGATGDPSDTIFINFDSGTTELVGTHVSNRGAPNNMHFAASPRTSAEVGGPQTYVGFFHTHNQTLVNLQVLPGADALRVMGDFFNTPQIGPDGNGTDPFSVIQLNVVGVDQP